MRGRSITPSSGTEPSVYRFDRARGAGGHGHAQRRAGLHRDPGRHRLPRPHGRRHQGAPGPDGWTVENDGSYGFVFCHKAGVRRMVAVVQVDPAQPEVGTYPAPTAPA